MQPRTLAPTARRATLLRALALTGALCGALAWATSSRAQAPAGNELPLRNLQIEVRQQQSGSGSQSGVSGSGAIVLQPGNSGGQFGISGGSSTRQEVRNLSQMMLVLNGRPTQMSLGNAVPLRLVQTFVVNGQTRVVPGTVMVEANSGFSARPVWRGGDSVELEIGTALARQGQSASAASTIVAPIGEWFTLAESMDAGDFRGSGTLSQGQSSSQGSLKVQLRISVR